MNVLRVSAAVVAASVMLFGPTLAVAKSAKHSAVAKVAAVRKSANHAGDPNTPLYVAGGAVVLGLGVAAAAGAFSSSK